MNFHLKNLSVINSLKKILGSTGCHNVHGSHVTANNSTNNNVVVFFVSDFKTVYYNNN